MKKFLILLIIFTVSILLLIKQISTGNSLPTENNNVDGKISVILTGFGSGDDEGNWTGETAPFIKKLEKPQDVGNKIGMCQNGYEGYLYGNKVLLATTGMAKIRTTACLTDILHYYDKSVKEVVFVGIAGITPAKGGMFDDAGNYRYSEPAMLGDVCINSASFDFDLQYYSSDREGSKLPFPVFWAQDDSYSSQYSDNASALAQELYNASAGVVWTDTPQPVKNINLLYHGNSRKPKVWGLRECIEATGDMYWNDIRSDRTAREMAAAYLNKIYGTSVDSNGIVIMTSMEALPAGDVVGWWNASENTDVAFAYVRGASNFDHAYLNADRTPALSGQDTIAKFSGLGGAEYAIETASLPVLKMFEMRNSRN